jgi:hypothetical protein
MSDEEATTEVSESETETESSTEDSTGPEVVLDAEALEEQERTVDDLVETVEQQEERIEELEDLLLDLSTRVADGNSMGVCPDCHGPVLKSDPWFRSAKIKCMDCERVFHEY